MPQHLQNHTCQLGPSRLLQYSSAGCQATPWKPRHRSQKPDWQAAITCRGHFSGKTLLQPRQKQCRGGPLVAASTAAAPETPILSFSQLYDKQVVAQADGKQLGFVDTAFVDPRTLALVCLGLKAKPAVDPFAGQRSTLQLASLGEIGDVVLLQKGSPLPTADVPNDLMPIFETDIEEATGRPIGRVSPASDQAHDQRHPICVYCICIEAQRVSYISLSLSAGHMGFCLPTSIIPCSTQLGHHHIVCLTSSCPYQCSGTWTAKAIMHSQIAQGLHSCVMSWTVQS